MYTFLDHSSIRTAVKWLLYETGKTKRNRKCVSVPVSSSDKSVHFGRSTLSVEDRFDLTYENIIDIMNFDLNNNYFTIGSFTGKQTCGIPMGSPLSPALAVIVCAYYESRIYAKIEKYGWSNTLVGSRYMDDVLSFVTHDGTKESIHRATCICNWIEFGYHRLMELECENTNVEFKFLSSHVTAISGSPISIRYNNKNSESLATTNSQKFLTFQNYGSLAPAQQKKSVVISSLYRLDMNCIELKDLVNSVRELFFELSTLHYPTKVLHSAFNSACKNESLRFKSIPISSIFGDTYPY